LLWEIAAVPLIRNKADEAFFRQLEEASYSLFFWGTLPYQYLLEGQYNRAKAIPEVSGVH